MSSTAPATDRFGNPFDPIVRYARGAILKDTDEEVARMLRARHLVAERVRNLGQDSVYDLSGMNRGSGIELSGPRLVHRRKRVVELAKLRNGGMIPHRTGETHQDAGQRAHPGLPVPGREIADHAGQHGIQPKRALESQALLERLVVGAPLVLRLNLLKEQGIGQRERQE